MRKALMISVSVLAVATGAMAMSGRASAQNAAAANADQSPPPTEVVVTAQKRTENIEKVPVAISVVSPSTLAKANASNISDLNNLVPSVELNGTINGRVPMGIRGISSDSNEGAVGVPSGVAIEIDGVPIPSDSYAGNQLEDAQSIEVLKGPQGTLGGRTAAAGVINVVTHQPTSTFKAGGEATFTSDNEDRGDAYVSGPISDKVQFSLAGWDGQIPYPITNTYYGTKTHQDIDGVRGKLKFYLSDDLDVTLMGSYQQQNSYGFNFVYTYVTPGATLLFPGSPLTEAALFPGITPSLQNLSYNSPVTQANSYVQDGQASAIINYHLGQDTLTSTTSYLDERQANTQDLFAVGEYFFTVLTGGAVPYNNTQTLDENVSQVTEELKLVSPADLKFSYILGAFYSDDRIDETVFRSLPPAAEDLQVIPDTQTFDVYGHFNYKLTDDTSLLGGVRYNYDVLKYSYNQITYVPQGPQQSSGSNSFGTVVGDVSLQQKLAPNSMVYATYSHGYSPAAYNTAIALANNKPLTPVAEESVDSFEIGSKGTYFENRLMLNADVFYTNYDNYQIQVATPLPGYINPPLILESGGARTEGVELDSAFQATPNTTLTFNAAYIDAIFTNYKDAPCPGNMLIGGAIIVPPQCYTNNLGQLVQNVTGKQMPNSPNFKFTLGGEQRIPLPNTSMSLLVGGAYAYRTSAQMLADQNPQAIQPAFGILDLHATLDNIAGHFAVTFFVNNVTDHIYYTDMEDFWTSPWAGFNTVIGQPARDARRYFGVKISAQY